MAHAVAALRSEIALAGYLWGEREEAGKGKANVASDDFWKEDL